MEVTQRTTIPTDPTASVLAQQYNVMIHKGLEYSYITNGLVIVLFGRSYLNWFRNIQRRSMFKYSNETSWRISGMVKLSTNLAMTGF
ncbi:hypothetical protein V1525DRAFT_413754 [Lipomyces kononenkoae]|uniref:Uncharacterized protein n=1 Tax=Lipomyces kononenkoae TaxID=34357 RepID=A0ACC3SRP2_LIPKO